MAGGLARPGTGHPAQTSPSFQAWVDGLQGVDSGTGVTIYGDPDSRSSRVLWMAREIEAQGGLKVNHQMIGRDYPFSAETDLVNPNRRMPFMDDNGIYMFESMAISEPHSCAVLPQCTPLISFPLTLALLRRPSPSEALRCRHRASPEVPRQHLKHPPRYSSTDCC